MLPLSCKSFSPLINRPDRVRIRPIERMPPVSSHPDQPDIPQHPLDASRLTGAPSSGPPRCPQQPAPEVPDNSSRRRGSATALKESEVVAALAISSGAVDAAAPEPAKQLLGAMGCDFQTHNHIKNQQCRVQTLLLFALSTAVRKSLRSLSLLTPGLRPRLARSTPPLLSGERAWPRV